MPQYSSGHIITMADIKRAMKTGAATDIQRIVRGHQARQRVKTMKKGGRRRVTRRR